MNPGSSTDHTPALNPIAVWEEMLAGNQRFIDGTPLHPRQDAEVRQTLAGHQKPRAAIFGCSDSRLSAEIIFDLGLGDVFVVRNAGQVLSSSVLGSLEYAVSVLEVPLILVLGHDACGAVQAAIEAYHDTTTSFSNHVRALIEPILPAVAEVALQRTNPSLPLNPIEVGRAHLRDTATELVQASPMIRAHIEQKTLAIIAANYNLLEGRVEPDFILQTSS